MRKSLFLAMAAVVLLAGCSKESDGIMDQGDDNGGNNVNADAVKIELGTKGMSANVTPGTRGTLDKFNDTKVGIFALAKGSTDPWVLTDGNTCIMNNEEGTITSAENEVVAGIAFAKDFYYPMSSEKNYSFFGYYPRQTDATNDGTTVTVAYPTFDGTQDIIYGSKAADKIGDYDGYNAKYFRKATGAVKPEIRFNHLLTRLKFNIIAGGDSSEEIAKAKELTINAIRIKNVPAELTLVVADRTGNTAGTLTAGPLQPANAYTLKDNQNADADADAVTPGNAPTGNAMGESMMLFTQANYTAEIDMILKGETITSTVTIALKDQEFAAGTSYNVNLTVFGLSRIEIDAVLTEWAKGDDADIEIN